MNKTQIFNNIYFTQFHFSLNAAPKLDVKSAIVVDYNSDKVLYEIDADAHIYPASMTKIMTSIIAFDLLNKVKLI